MGVERAIISVEVKVPPTGDGDPLVSTYHRLTVL
jgi:hypothetical protein